MVAKQIVLFNGSPRKNGTSFSFARTIQKLIEEQGHSAIILHVGDYFQKDAPDNLRKTLAGCDAMGLIMPLFVDTLPYQVIGFLEKLNAQFRGELQGKGFFAVGQNGFPDVTLMQPMMGTCACFARSAGMEWLGGLAYAGGVIINGAFLENLGKKGEKITAGFKLAVEDIIQDKPIRPESQMLLNVKIPEFLNFPLSLYLNYNARKTAKQAGVKDLRRKVYLEEKEGEPA